MNSVRLGLAIDIQPYTMNGITWVVQGRESTADYRAKLKKARKKARAEWIRHDMPTLLGRVRLDLFTKRGHYLDEPNIWGGVKGFIDGFCQKGIIPDDRPEFLKCGEIFQHIDPGHVGRELIIFEFVPLEDQGLFQ